LRNGSPAVQGRRLDGDAGDYVALPIERSNGEQVNRLGALALHRKPSVNFSGYWQRHVD
jgi:hypothetical protein